MAEMKRALGYLRVSTEMQVEGYSLDAQRDSIKKVAKGYDIEIIKIYEDRGKSGKSEEGRLDFLQMMKDIEEGTFEVEYVMVYKLSRFGRNAADVFASLQRLQDCGVNLFCTSDMLDSSKGSGKLMIAVLSAVAELERVNILEQTMSGRNRKAEEGKWNGGYPPIGYRIKEDYKLEIEETEAEAIRVMYDKFISTDLGYNGVAKYLNRQSIKKIPRKNGKLTEWSHNTVRSILDNPVYCGRIAYGRRKMKKKKGTKNTYQQVRQDTYIIVDDAHPGIVSVEDWERAKEKRLSTGKKSPSNAGRDRVHLLSGILKCPECNSPMYASKGKDYEKKDGTITVRHYYACSKAKQERGRTCTYKKSLRKDLIEPDVLLAIRKLVQDPIFAEEVKSKIGRQIDTTEIDGEIDKYRSSLRQVGRAKENLEREIDTLPYDTENELYMEQMRKDKNMRLNKLYAELYELEEAIDDLLKKRQAVETNALNLEQVYKILLNFDKLYDRMTDAEQRKLIEDMVDTVEIYKEARGKELSRLKAITFAFPVVYGGSETNRILLDNEKQVECVVRLEKR